MAARTICCTTRCARFGIETTFVNPRDIDAWRAAIRPETRLLFGETLGNPGLDVLDIETVAQIGQDHKIPLLVDSTFTTPYLLRPFDHGAGLLYHSATKFLGGHGTTIGGVLSEGGTFDFEASGRFPSCRSPIRASTTWCLPRKAPWRRSCCAPGARACATSAPA